MVCKKSIIRKGLNIVRTLKKQKALRCWTLRALFSSQIWCNFIETVFNEKPYTSFFGLGVFFLPASYGPNERVVVFGDSLSDNGNCFALTGGQLPPGPPQGAYGETFDGSGLSFPGRFI
jgi:hypothetical protein